jgi:putative nucleotidyltransferase with HDIG domain
MTTLLNSNIRERVQQIDSMPAIPAVFLPLLKMFGSNAEQINIDEVVKLISYDGTITAQCLRMAASPLFGLAQPPKSIRTAVVNLGLRRVETILLTCCLGQAFPSNRWILDPVVFWRHSLGCAMVCRQFSEKLANSDHEQAYLAGLLHDIGFMVNCLAFPAEFAHVMQQALRDGTPLAEAEQAAVGFTHADTGQALAEKWALPEPIAQVIAGHHSVSSTAARKPLVALVHLCDHLCRMCDLGYGYYECRKADLVSDPAWNILAAEHEEIKNVDLVRFTFELDEEVKQIQSLVDNIFGPSSLTSSNLR